jgi:fatty acid-binding protein DegV
MKGLIASLLNIKPMIGVEKINGTYIQLGQARTFKNAIHGLVDRIKALHPPGSSLYVQVLHALNQDGGEALKELIDKTFNCTWLPMRPMSLVLGAHTGRSMVGVAFAKSEALAGIPAS